MNKDRLLFPRAAPAACVCFRMRVHMLSRSDRCCDQPDLMRRQFTSFLHDPHLMLKGASSSAALLVSCRIAALAALYAASPGKLFRVAVEDMLTMAN